ncbi:MAG: exosome complex RNA-binding protein Csl4 [Desulfurococcaceae archaeon]
MSKKRDLGVVYPGEELGVEEEFIPDHGVYVDKNGYIRSLFLGRVLIDSVRKTISVRRVNQKILIPKINDIVEGVVTSTSDDIAFVKIYSVNDRYVRSIDFTGILHVSQVSTEYLETIYDAMRIGEVVRARILSINYPFQLSTKEPVLGVIVAYCSNCGSILYKRDNKLECVNCGSVEKRKISNLYIYR